jgi:hypothetical protein
VDPDRIRLVAAAVALISGWATIRITRLITFQGVGIEDGGGYTTLLLVVLSVDLAAVAVALS